MTSPSSKPVALSRRAVLGAGGVGLAAVLSACARTVHPPVDAATSESASASPSASSTLPSANKSYQGKVTFDNFEKYDTSEPMSVYLLTDTPTQVEGDRIRYFWRARSLVDQNAKRHLTEGDNRDKSLARAEDSQGQAMRIVVEYKEGAWFMSTQKDKDAGKSSGSASTSAS